MMRPIFVLLSVGMLSACSIGGSEKSAKDAVVELRASQPVPDNEQGLLVLMNRERQARGLKPLKTEPRLTRAAKAHSQDMVKRGYFEHVCPSGTSFIERMLDQNYPHSSSSENLAICNSAEVCNDIWMKSPEHRKNMLGKKYEYVGIGRVGNHWTAVYAAEDGS